MRRSSVAVLAAAMLPAALAVASLPTAQAAPRATEKVPVAKGTGGAVVTVDPEATRVGLEVLRKGGNAVDAAVAAAATLGVTEPYSAGIGGGGFFVYYDAASGDVHTIDGRETAPAAMTETSFQDPVGTPIPFFDAVNSGLSVGVPGTPLTWQEALDRWGSVSLAEALRPATQVASRGFVVDQTFHDQTAANADRFRLFTPTAELFLPGDEPPRVGSIFRNLDLAHTYRLLSRQGVDVLYGGRLGREVVATVQEPPVADGVDVRSGLMELSDLRAYTAPLREPTESSYRGLDLYGMSVPSSGGIAVGETLNILEGYDMGSLDRTTALHAWFEASALAFADRNRYVGDVPDVPVDELLSQEFADERRCEIDLDEAAVKPVPPGTPDGDYAGCGTAVPAEAAVAAGGSTTHLSTADRWGNVVSYTLTIEQTGGSGIVVPDRGFLLNNELTDFNFTPTQGEEPDPNLPGPGKRPRSSMSPTIVLDDGEPLLAVGSPGGATIITTVEQVLLNRIDFGMSLPDAVAAPRASQRNLANTSAEPAFIDLPEADGLAQLGHVFATPAEIGAVAAIEFLPDGRLLAAAEPVRRGGGSAGVVRPR
jgi:gamma-glutamyltranspeptidase / glutathione hydrolase